MRRSEQGSVLILMPAAVLVLVILAAITVDFSIAYLAQRQLKDAAASAANDAAGAGLDQARLRNGDGSLTLDPALATDIATRVIDGATLHLTAAPVVTVDGNRVTVELEGDAAYVFSGALPGAPKHAHVRARASAQLLGAG